MKLCFVKKFKIVKFFIIEILINLLIGIPFSLFMYILYGSTLGIYVGFLTWFGFCLAYTTTTSIIKNKVNKRTPDNYCEIDKEKEVLTLKIFNEKTRRFQKIDIKLNEIEAVKMEYSQWIELYMFIRGWGVGYNKNLKSKTAKNINKKYVKKYNNKLEKDNIGSIILKLINGKKYELFFIKDLKQEYEKLNSFISNK